MEVRFPELAICAVVMEEDILITKHTVKGFPGGAVVENLPANARGLGSIPDQGTRSHMHAKTKSLHAATKELASCN